MSISRNQIFKVALLAAALFVLAASFFTSDTLVRVLNGLLVGISFGVGTAFMPLIVRAFKRRWFDRIDQLAIGILLTWMSLMTSRLANALPRIFPDMTMDEVGRSLLVAVAAYMGIVAGVFHVTSAGMVDDMNDPPQGPGKLVYNRRLLYASIVLGTVVGSLLIVLQKG